MVVAIGSVVLAAAIGTWAILFLHHGFARPARDRRSRRAAERDRRWNRDDLMRIEAVDIQASNVVSMAITGSSAGQPDVP